MNKSTRFLVSNDDGIWAPGLKTLCEVAEDFGEVTVVAPHIERSGASHMISIHYPLRVESIDDKKFAVEGSPADCVKVGLKKLLKVQPDIVLSGINRGPNLGQDTMYSGTVGAAMEAALHGIGAIAFSTHGKRPLQYDTAGRVARYLLEKQGLFNGFSGVLNVNVPSIPFNEIKGMRFTKLGKRIYGDDIIENTDPRGKPYYWIGGDTDLNSSTVDTDCELVEQGFVTLTVLKPSFYDQLGQQELEKQFEGELAF